MAAMQAQHHALATKPQAQERAKTAELEQALERSRQREQEQELTRQVLEAAAARSSVQRRLQEPGVIVDECRPEQQQVWGAGSRVSGSRNC